MRRMSGICPPSNPGRVWPPVRAVCPLPPRPAVLPIPEPGPRPLRMRARCEPTGGFRSWSASRVTGDLGLGAWDLVLARGFRAVFAFGFGILLLAFFFRRHLDEVPHLLEHAAQRGMIGVYDFRLVMLEAQRLERPLHTIRVAADRSHLLAAQLPFPQRRPDRIPARAVFADDLVRNRASGERHFGHVAARGLDGLPHRFADLVRLAGRDPDLSFPVADCDQRVEAEAPAALHDFRHAIDRDDVLDHAVALAPPAIALASFAAATSATAAATASASTARAARTARSPVLFDRRGRSRGRGRGPISAR